MQIWFYGFHGSTFLLVSLRFSMTAQNFIDFVAKVSEDQELQALISESMPMEAMIALGRDNGFLFTVADIQQASFQLQNQHEELQAEGMEDDELTLDQLSAASGGANVIGASYISQWFRLSASASLSSASKSGGKL